ncbi:MAG TPA: hypothetical protein VGV15_19935, partial [Terriglobales bacterium]|nr:hypothetical protein [Terriglobales bacterium]
QMPRKPGYFNDPRHGFLVQLNSLPSGLYATPDLNSGCTQKPTSRVVERSAYNSTFQLVHGITSGRKGVGTDR